MRSSKVLKREKIRKSIRRKVSGSAEIPRLSVFKSNKAIYVQFIDDTQGHTLLQGSSTELGKKSVNVAICREVGEKIGAKAKEKGLDKVVFDRGGYPYHGRVKALAEGVRKAGIVF